MFFDAGGDLKCKREGARARFSIDERARPRGHAIEKRLQLAGERLGFGDQLRLEVNLPVVAHADREALLLRIVHRDILLSLIHI